MAAMAHIPSPHYLLRKTPSSIGVGGSAVSVASCGASSYTPRRPPPPLSPTCRSSALLQALLLRDQVLVGRLVNPTACSQPASSGSSSSSGNGPGNLPEKPGEPPSPQQQQLVAEVEVELHFSSLIRGRSGSSSAGSEQAPQPLCLSVDECFAKHTYGLQVVGRQPQVQGSTSTSFAVPHAFRATGRELTTGLQLAQQWREVQRRHQAQRAATGQPVSAENIACSSSLIVLSGASPQPLKGLHALCLEGGECDFLPLTRSGRPIWLMLMVSSLVCCAGDGLERLQAIFEAGSTGPSWLKVGAGQAGVGGCPCSYV